MSSTIPSTSCSNFISASFVRDAKTNGGNIDIDSEGSYPVDDIKVQKKTSKHEIFFQTYKKEYGYDDMFIIEASNGHVIYSALKNADYGENLKQKNNIS